MRGYARIPRGPLWLTGNIFSGPTRPSLQHPLRRTLKIQDNLATAHSSFPSLCHRLTELCSGELPVAAMKLIKVRTSFRRISTRNIGNLFCVGQKETKSNGNKGVLSPTTVGKCAQKSDPKNPVLKEKTTPQVIPVSISRSQLW